MNSQPNVIRSTSSRELTLSPTRRTLLGGAVASVAAPAFAVGMPRRGALDAFIRSQLHSAAIPGMAVGIARHGEVILQRGYGSADLASGRNVTIDTVFHLASVTKTVTATAVLMLAEEGKIDLDAPANRYLDFAVINPAYPQLAITARDLLMHLSGISDKTYYEIDFRVSGRDSPQALDVFLKDYLAPGGQHYSVTGSFSSVFPGSRYDYCNVGYALLGYLAGRVAGEDLRIFTQRRLFAPLGMHHVSWTIAGVPNVLRATPYDIVENQLMPVEPVGFPDWPVGMLRSSIAGFMPFVAASANGGAAGDRRILTTSSQAEMLAMRTPPGLPTWLTGQGLGWAESQLGPARRINHWGGDPGVFTAVYLDPASTTGVAIFSNASATAANRTAIKAVAERLFAEAQA